MKTPLRVTERPQRIVVRPHALLTVIVLFGGLGGGALVKGQLVGVLALIPIAFVARQRLAADQAGLTFVNFRTYRIPWADVRDFETSSSGLSSYVEVRKQDGTRSPPIWATQFDARAGYYSSEIAHITNRLRALRGVSLGLPTTAIASPALESALAAAERGDPEPIDHLLATHQIESEVYSERLHALAAAGRVDLEQLRQKRRHGWDEYEALARDAVVRSHRDLPPSETHPTLTGSASTYPGLPSAGSFMRIFNRAVRPFVLLLGLFFSAVPTLVLNASDPLPADPDPEDIYLKQSMLTYGWLAFAPLAELICVPIAYLLNRFDGNQGHTIGDKLFVFVAGFCLTGAADALWRYYLVYAARRRYRLAGDVMDGRSLRLMKLARANDHAWILQLAVGALLAWRVP